MLVNICLLVCMRRGDFQYNLGPAGVELKVGVVNKRKRSSEDMGTSSKSKPLLFSDFHIK